MKKLIGLVFALVLVFSVASAYAGGAATVPQNVQDQFAARGAKANYSWWFPVIPELSEKKWTNIVVLSNFNTDPITVQCWFTHLSRQQTIQTYDLDKYEKWFIYMSTFGDDVYDVWCGCDQYFGAAALLLENGSIVTAWPPI
jgi:hypothetical protein